MNLEAEIARTQLSSLPPAIVKRLLTCGDIATLIQAGYADVNEIGLLYFSDVRSTLVEACLDVDTELPARQGVGRASISRDPNGLCRVRGTSGVEILLPQLSLLDPSADVRLNGARYLAQRALPCWPRSARWEDVLADRPLSDSEFSLVLDELQNLADPVIDGIAVTIGGGRFKALDVVPVEVPYYESLLGGMPSTTTASHYVEHNLNPHLQCILQKDKQWGLRCIHAVCVSELVDPVGAAVAVSNDSLLAAIETVGIGVTSFAALATYKLAAARAVSDERFASFAKDALDRIIQRTSRDDAELDVAALHLALVRLTLSVVGQVEDFVSAPPFWKRLAAFAHASMLVETIDFSGADIGALVMWCDSYGTQDTGAVEILDHLKEPGWRADAQSVADLWTASLIRAVRWTPSGAEKSPGLTLDQQCQLQQLHPKLILAAGVPDPISGARRGRDAVNVQVMDENLLSGFDPSATVNVLPTPFQTWNALAYSSRIYAFTDSLMLRVRDMAKTLRIGEPREIDDIFALLVLCCDVASTQADLELAEIVAACVIDASGKLTNPPDAAKAATVIVLASGAALDQGACLLWAADKLLTIAYQLPRGACCERFAQTVSTIQKFIPIDKRRWGKAIVTAKSAS